MAAGFQNLRIWQQGHALLMEVYKITREYPAEEKYGLSKDTRRSSNSTIANIAESHGRYYYKDKVRVLYTARGEAEETQSHLLVAKSLNYASPERIQKLIDDYENLIIGINGHINDLEKKSHENITKNHNSSQPPG